MSAEERFAMGMKRYEKEDYLGAYDDFRIVTLQHQGSALADDAQYLMGECRFAREEYVLAAYEYETLIRAMPTSEFVSMARYKRALSYYKLSPRSHHDQEYTVRAIDEFQNFIEYHPTDSLVVDAEAKIHELNTKLAKKEFENGITYMRMEYYRSAILSFDHVLEKYHDTPYADRAQLKKAEALYFRKRYAEAKQEIEKFFSKYPESDLLPEAEKLRRDIETALVRIRPTGTERPDGRQTASGSGVQL